MPVARGPQINARSAVLVGLSGVVVAGVIGALVLWAASSSGDVEIQLGDTDFDAGSAERLAGVIADGGPWLVPDVAGGRRDLIVNHLGDDPETGWHAFDARPVDETGDCFFEWDDERELFVLVTIKDDVTCGDGTALSTGEGDGVTIYPVAIDDGRVRVDINFATDDSSEETDS
jgi:hypothetical protein